MSIDIEKIKEMVEKSSNIIIVAHKNLDLDALGASLGFYYVANSLGKQAYLLIEESKHEDGVSKVIQILNKDYLDVNVKNLDELKMIINQETLLVVMDTHNPSLIQNENILDLVKKVIVIDHHVVHHREIENEFSYIDEDEASVSEIVIRIIQELKVFIPDLVATTMLAGIIIDTNSFLYKTSSNTHDTASYLLRKGASIEGVQYLLKEDFSRYEIRNKIIQNSNIINGKYAIAISNDTIYLRVEDLAKISNELLLFKGIEASFTIGKIGNKVCVSARSLGKANVEEIMKELGGGGHESDAAAQIENLSILEVKERIINIVNRK